MAEPTYGFPLLDPDSIVDTLAEYQIQIKLSQLRAPNADFIFNVCSQIVQKVSNLGQNSLGQSVDEAVESLNTQHPDIYKQMISRNLMSYHIGRIARAAQVTDYTARDLAFPDTYRTKVILSGFINFLAHIASVTDRVRGIREEASAARAERDTLERQVKETQAVVDKIRAKRTEEESKAEALEKRHHDLVPRVMMENQSAHAIKASLERIKTEKEKAMKRKEALSADVAKLQDQIQMMQGRIVRSPERIRKNISLMGSTVAEDKRVVAQTENRIRDLQAKQSAFLHIEKEVKICVQQLQAIEKETKELAATERQLADARDLHERKSSDKTGLLLKKERVDQQRINAQQKLGRAERQAADKRAASALALERLQQDYAELSVERRVNDKEVESIRKEADEVEYRIAGQLQTHEAELNELLNAYWNLRQQLETYMDALGFKLGFHDEME